MGFPELWDWNPQSVANPGTHVFATGPQPPACLRARGARGAGLRARTAAGLKAAGKQREEDVQRRDDE